MEKQNCFSPEKILPLVKCKFIKFLRQRLSMKGKSNAQIIQVPGKHSQSLRSFALLLA